MARASDNSTQDRNSGLAIGLGLATVAATAGAFLLSRSSKRPEIDTDAPHWTLDSAGQGARPVIGKTLLINAPRERLFKAWQRVEDFPRFMENVDKVEKLDGERSRWTIKAPAGKTVTLLNRITETIPNESISWQSEDDSDVANSGRVRFEEAPARRGTYVSLVLSYDPPGGPLARLAAKLFQREPAIQARRDLRRFKQLIETGEVSTNASPSARESETPRESHV